VEKTVSWIDKHLRRAAARANACELDELRRLFPKYEPIDWLGGGGMGVVYLVRHRTLCRLVALKLLRPAFRDDPEFVARFRIEAQAMAKLNHPRIVPVMDFGLAEDYYFLEMEYLAGGTLRERLRGADGCPRCLPLKEALAIASAICEGLQHAHAQGVIHRDIKTANILFDGEGNVKVADLGLAKVCGDVAHTASAKAMGTWHYMPPEQEKSAATVDERADLYSVGVVLSEMLTGERRPVDPASQKVGLTGAAAVKLDAVIHRALKPDPKQRFESAADMKAAIDEVRKLIDEPWYVRFWKWSKLYRRVSAAVLAVALVVLVVWRMVLPAPEEGVLLWGGDTNGGAPYVWEDRGKLKGFEVELVEHIAAKLKLRPKFVQTSWQELPDELRRGGIHVIFNGYAWTPQRAQEMKATIPYAQVRMRLIVPKKEANQIGGWDDLHQPGPNGKWEVGTLRASNSEKYLLKHFADTVAIETPGNGTTDALLLLLNGQLQASAQDEFTAGHYLKQPVFTPLTTVGEPVAPDSMVAYTHRTNADLRDRIDEALKALMRDGTLKKIYTAYGVWHEGQEKLEDVWRDWPPKDPVPDEELWPFAWMLLKAAGMTVVLACVSMPLAMLLGLFVALGRMYGPRWVSVPLAVYVEVLRGTPLLLQLFAIYFLLPYVGIFLPAFWAGVIGLAINYSAYESEHYRAGLLSVPRGQMEAALTLGLSKWIALRRIILPQALRTVVPSVTNDFIALFKDTAVCSVIAVVELTGGYQRLAVDQPQLIFTFALITAVLYLMMSYPLAALARWLERRPQPVTT
jgi:polar amino acid transport system substrate-binding protein